MVVQREVVVCTRRGWDGPPSCQPGPRCGYEGLCLELQVPWLRSVHTLSPIFFSEPSQTDALGGLKGGVLKRVEEAMTDFV